MRAAALVLLALVTALPAVASAAEEEERDPIKGDISAAEWRAMVAGRAVTYLIDGQIWAREVYDPKTNAVSIALADGTCMDGIWFMAEKEFCFLWAGLELSCFRHVREGGGILIIPMQDGIPSGRVQTVGSISDAPLPCGPALSS